MSYVGKSCLYMQILLIYANIAYIGKHCIFRQILSKDELKSSAELFEISVSHILGTSFDSS